MTAEPVPVIGQTTFVFHVLHRLDQPLKTLERALEESDTGHAVGRIVYQSTVPLTNKHVNWTLRSLGNDGTFFDDDLERSYDTDGGGDVRT